MWVIRFLRTLSLYSLMVTSLGLFALSYFNPKLFDNIRLFLLDTTGPVIVVFDKIVAHVYTLQDKAIDILYVYEINNRLLEKLQDYNEKSIQLDLLTQEIRKLYDTLQYTRQFGVPDGFLAKIVGHTGGVYDTAFILDKGAVNGVQVGQIMVFDGYMAGYITDVSNTISRGIALTNINASVPVMNAQGKKRGLILGDGRRLPKFIYADTITDFGEGDVLYTSGDGGMFPPGLPVGVISAIYNQNNVRILPYVHEQDMTFVYILRHKPELILQAE